MQVLLLSYFFNLDSLYQLMKPVYFCNVSLQMNFKFLFAFLIFALHVNAQQPPAQLPSLLDGTSIQMPVLHEKEDPAEFLQKNIFVKVSVSKTSAYAGEPILVTYKLYTSLNSQARVSKQPAFSGCSVMELTAGNESHEATIQGKLFHVFLIRRVQVIPLEEGPMQLGQAFIDNVVQLTNEDGTSVENYSYTASNEPVNIEVKPLPSKGRPANFSGLVGKYFISASIDHDKIPAGEDATLRITISGNGNIQGIHIPSVQWPIGTEHFEGSDSQQVDLDNFPVTGYKIFEIPFIGDKEGNTVIEPISFSYFDPVLELYKTISTSRLPVIITKPLSRAQQMKEIVTEDVSNRKFLWIVGAIAAAVLITWFISSRAKPQQKVVSKPAVEKPNEISLQEKIAEEKKREASKIFEELNKLGNINSSTVFFSTTRLFLIKALQVKLGSASVTEQDLIIVMKQNDSFTALAISCENIFDTCNRNLYSPLIDDDICERVYFELTAIIKKMYELA